MLLLNNLHHFLPTTLPIYLVWHFQHTCWTDCQPLFLTLFYAYWLSNGKCLQTVDYFVDISANSNGKISSCTSDHWKPSFSQSSLYITSSPSNCPTLSSNSTTHSHYSSNPHSSRTNGKHAPHYHNYRGYNLLSMFHPFYYNHAMSLYPTSFQIALSHTLSFSEYLLNSSVFSLSHFHSTL